MRLIMFFCLTLHTLTFIHASNNNTFTPLKKNKRQELIKKLSKLFPCTGNVEETEQLFAPNGPWDTTECDCSTCPIQTVTYLQKNRCTCQLCCATFFILSLLGVGTSISLCCCAPKGGILANVADIVGCSSLTSSAVSGVGWLSSDYCDSKLLNWASNHENWPSSETTPLLQQTFKPIEMRENL